MPLSGEVLVRYDFSGVTNPAANLPSAPINPVETAAGVDASGFASPGIANTGIYRRTTDALNSSTDLASDATVVTLSANPEIVDDRFAFSLWNQNNAGNTLQNVIGRGAEYVSFTVDFSEETTLDALTFKYWSNESNQSPDVAVFTSRTSNFAGTISASEAVQTFAGIQSGSVTKVGSVAVFQNVQSLTVDLSSPTFEDLSDEVEIRIYFYNSAFNALTGYTWINDIQLIGTGGEPVGGAVPAGVAVSPKSRILTATDTFQLIAEVRPLTATDQTVTWSTSNASVATVNSNGLVTAVANGTAVITAETNTGSYTDTSVVTVANPVSGSGIGVIDADGWTVLTPSVDSRLVYVSSSEGSDGNDGLSPATPKATIGAADAVIRDGYPDWLMLKRGDTFAQPSLGRWKSGRSAAEPMVLTYYGSSGGRPVIKMTSELVNWNGQPRNHTAYVGLEFHRSISDPDSPDFTNTGWGYALRFVPGGSAATNLLVEDCVLRYCNLIVQDYNGGYAVNVHIRRNVVMNNWAHGTSGSSINPQGMFAEGIVNFYFEENLFHHNGWNENISGAGANQFNHNLYMGVRNDGDIVLRGNIISYGAANGIQLRSGGTATMNAFVGNAIGMNIGYFTAPAAFDGLTTADYNVVTDGRHQIPAGGAQTGAVFGLWMMEIGDVTVNHNVVANMDSGATSGTRTPYRDMTANEFGSGNLAWNWYEGDTQSLDPDWPDHTRNADSFGASLGVDDWEGFIAAAVSRGVREFPYEVSAYAYNDYIREGFNLPGVIPPYNLEEYWFGGGGPGAPVQGDVLAHYSFAGISNPAASLPSTPIAPGETWPGFSAGGFAAPGISATNSGVFRRATNALTGTADLASDSTVVTLNTNPEIVNDRFAFSLWNQNNPSNTLQSVLGRGGEYVSITIDPDQFAGMSLDSITFDYWSNENNQSPDVAVFTSVTSDFSGAITAGEAVQTFTSIPAGSVSKPAGTAVFSGVQSLEVDLSGPAFQNLTGEIQIRFYFYNSAYNAFTGYTWLDNIRVISGN